jgi:hypothetical protein
LKPSILEILRSIIENEVNASQLLQRLQGTTSKQSLANGTLEAVNIFCVAQRELVGMIGSNLVDFFFDGRVINWETADSSKRFNSLPLR